MHLILCIKCFKKKKKTSNETKKKFSFDDVTTFSHIKTKLYSM